MPIFHEPPDTPPEKQVVRPPLVPSPPPVTYDASMFDRMYLIERLKRGNSSTPDPPCDNAAAGLEIQRPRSALHSGDFREKRQRAQLDEGGDEAGIPLHNVQALDARPASRARARAISHASLSSFAFMPPTSPLVQQSNNTDLDFSSRPASRQTSRSPERNNRRHTFSPQSFHAYASTVMPTSAYGTPAARHLRRDAAAPYQAHQPRRSMTSFNGFQPHSSPQTPFLGSRRPSFSSEASPLHHAPMVGSYEESILRGRMSTIPSRPLNFIAKIGVLGRGQFKSNLKCPPHVAVPFPAVFYSYNSGNGPISDDSPSPYVGLIDLENSLPHQEEGNDSSKRKRRQPAPTPDTHDFDFRPDDEEQRSRDRSTEHLRRKEKKKRRSTSPKAPPGGSYRIPQVGQLQIVLKNPNKTAVKLFLVPYDLSDMEPGQKTFVRQRSYSAGPIIDMPMSSRKNLGTDRPEAALSNSDDPNDRPVLRYLIHLHICCPSKGRYYLYKSIRVVFANRVPDGKEKLRNEIQLPEPRYSTYKASRDSLAMQAPSSTVSQLASEKALRRRSAGFPLSQQAYDQMDGIGPSRSHPPLPPPAVEFTGGPAASNRFNTPLGSLTAIPFSLPRIASMPPRPLSREMDGGEDSPFRSLPGRESPTCPIVNGSSEADGSIPAFEKRDRDAFCAVSPTGTGLLAKRLRGLDVQRDGRDD